MNAVLVNERMNDHDGEERLIHSLERTINFNHFIINTPQVCSSDCVFILTYCIARVDVCSAFEEFQDFVQVSRSSGAQKARISVGLETRKKETKNSMK